MKKKIIIFLMFALILLNTTIFAGTITSSISSTTLNIGDTTTLTISATSATGPVKISSSNSNVVSIGNYQNWIEDNSISATLTAKSSGTATISISTECFDSLDDEIPVPFSKSITITVKAPVVETPNTPPVPSTPSTPAEPSTPSTSSAKSSNALLTNLGIKKYDFSGFRKAKNEGYSVTVPNSVTSVTPYYTKADSKASVSISGNKNLVEGTNIVKVTVTAEDGTKNIYKIHVIRKTSEDIEETTPNVIDETTSNEIYLTALSIGNLELSPAFDKKVFEYKAELKENLMELEINATANSKTATIKIDGNKDLKNGENKITITVTSEDGKQTVTYTIIVNKNVEKPLDIALLTSSIDTIPPIAPNIFNGIINSLNQNYIYIAIIIASIVYLGGFASYLLISESKLIGRKKSIYSAKYEGNRFK